MYSILQKQAIELKAKELFSTNQTMTAHTSQFEVDCKDAFVSPWSSTQRPLRPPLTYLNYRTKWNTFGLSEAEFMTQNKINK